MRLFNKNTGETPPVPLKKRILKMVIGGVIGITLGLLYYRFIGCTGGSCAITSNPFGSAIYGMIFGILIASF